MAGQRDFDVAEWSADANEAVEISFVAAGPEETNALSTFHPRFTYPIFGDEQVIFGYQDLRIQVRFAAHNLAPHVTISYSDKFKPTGDVKAPNIKETLQDFIPAEAFGDDDDFRARARKEPLGDFRPPGERQFAYKKNGREYEIWCGELTDPAVKHLIDRIQVMVSFFIEGGVPLNLDEEEWSLARWRVFFVYEKLSAPPTPDGSVYSLVGYSTSYRFVTYSSAYTTNSSTPFDFPPKPVSVAMLPNRSRISQFVIFPPHQGQAHGHHLYNTMVNQFLVDPACVEITVEDPNEAFDDLRDFCDFERFTQNGTFAQLRLNADIDPKLATKRPNVRVPTGKLVDMTLYEKLRKQNKCQSRQWMRLVDMWLLSQLPTYTRQGGVARLTQRARASDAGDRAHYLWRLLVKQRIYRQNKDIMMQYDLPERVELLEKTTEGQIQDYERLLRRFSEKREQLLDGQAGIADRSQRRKRHLIDDEEDSGAESEAKRAKVTDDDADE